MPSSPVAAAPDKARDGWRRRSPGDLPTSRAGRSWAFSTRAAWGCTTSIIPDELLFPLGVFKERLSQSALYAASRDVSDAEARAVYDWLIQPRA